MRSIPLVLALFGALLVPSGAVAATDPGQAVRDCAVDGDLDRTYPDAVLRRAVDQVPADLAEYSNCVELLGAAVLGPRTDVPAGGGGAADGREPDPSAPEPRAGGGAAAEYTSPSSQPSAGAPVAPAGPGAGSGRHESGTGPLLWLLLGGGAALLGGAAYLFRDRLQPQRGLRLAARALGLAPRGS